jgi:hypothetical protein
MLITDVDGDMYGDVIGQALPNVYWLEAKDTQCNLWNVMSIGTMPQVSHGNTQEYFVAQIIEGGKPEILLGAEDGISYFEIPLNPDEGNWRRTLIASEASGLGVGDIDGDGKLDITSSEISGKDKNRKIGWWKNPGDGSGNWKKYIIGTSEGGYPDRFAIADFNTDGRPDIIVTDEEQPVEPKWKVYWFEQPSNPQNSNWKKHILVTQYTTNSLDIADMDRDGDTDIITGEHRGTKKLIIWENTGSSFKPHIVSEGKENHLGGRVYDLDKDGDLDIISICWDDYQNLYLWRNDAKKKDINIF